MNSLPLEPMLSRLATTHGIRRDFKRIWTESSALFGPPILRRAVQGMDMSHLTLSMAVSL